MFRPRFRAAIFSSLLARWTKGKSLLVVWGHEAKLALFLHFLRSRWPIWSQNHFITTQTFEDITKEYLVLAAYFEFLQNREHFCPGGGVNVNSLKGKIIKHKDTKCTGLQWRAPYHCHSTKFLINFWQRFDIFLTTFWWLSFQLPNQNARTMRGGVVKLHVPVLTIDISASHSSYNLIC